MINVELGPHLGCLEKITPLTALPIAVEVETDQLLEKYLADLSPDTAWGDRQKAAKRLGDMRCQEALPWMLEALPGDPFWMVRCAIIQAVEKIGLARAIPVLQDVVVRDEFQVVRSYAQKAIERLAG